MSMKALMAALLICCAPLSAAVGDAQSSRDSLNEQSLRGDRFLLELTLPSGLKASHIVYRKEKLRNRWLIQARASTGLRLTSIGGEPVPSLSVDELRALVSLSYAFVATHHAGQVDEIQLDVPSIEGLQEDGVSYLRGAPIPPDHDPLGSQLLVTVASSWLTSKAFVRAACADAILLKKRCPPSAISMNEFGFQPGERRLRWADSKALPDLGLDWGRVWFGINLEDVR